MFLWKWYEYIPDYFIKSESDYTYKRFITAFNHFFHVLFSFQARVCLHSTQIIQVIPFIIHCRNTEKFHFHRLRFWLYCYSRVTTQRLRNMKINWCSKECDSSTTLTSRAAFIFMTSDIVFFSLFFSECFFFSFSSWDNSRGKCCHCSCHVGKLNLETGL